MIDKTRQDKTFRCWEQLSSLTYGHAMASGGKNRALLTSRALNYSIPSFFEPIRVNHFHESIIILGPVCRVSVESSSIHFLRQMNPFLKL